MIYSKKHVRGPARGFTLIEILVVIGIIAVLAAVVLVAVNPSRQFKLARDSQRVSNVNALLNAIDQNIAEHGGIFTCASSTPTIPAHASVMADQMSGGSGTSFDVADCLVPAYISALPFDPSMTGAHYTNTQNYNTGYTVSQDPTTNQITVAATGEINPIIYVLR